MTTFTCISDTHNQHKLIDVPNADIILHSGDCTGTGTTKQIREFCEWYGSLPHKHKILIAGNHDWGFEENMFKHRKICEDYGIVYLQDSGCEIDGINIYGSPQTPEFCNWAFNCWKTKEEWLEDKTRGNWGKGYNFIGKFWDKIPSNTDIFPPFGIMDKCPESVGCKLLLEKVKEIKPAFHIFGHIHEGRGEEVINETTFINASSLDGKYAPSYNKACVYEFIKNSNLEKK